MATSGTVTYSVNELDIITTALHSIIELRLCSNDL